MIVVKILFALIFGMYLVQNHFPAGLCSQVAGQNLPTQEPRAGRGRNAVRYKELQKNLREMKQQLEGITEFTKDARFGILTTISHVIMPIMLGMNFTMMLYLSSINMIPRGEAIQIVDEYEDNNMLHRHRGVPNGPPSYEEATGGDNEFTNGAVDENQEQ